ncbi:MAG: arsenate reductase family protein [Defluviitaleaceae bacterium]|nr:arsenate reductase family protein [Defluviitaleaceae bacterium]
MNIQIFGKSKCFDTKKAERWFKERRHKFQSIDLAKFGMSRGELQSVARGVGGLDKLVDAKSKEYERQHLAYLADTSDLEDRLLEHPALLLTPIVRNGKQATVGYTPEIWAAWEAKG